MVLQVPAVKSSPGILMAPARCLPGTETRRRSARRDSRRAARACEPGQGLSVCIAPLVTVRVAGGPPRVSEVINIATNRGHPATTASATGLLCLTTSRVRGSSGSAQTWTAGRLRVTPPTAPLPLPYPWPADRLTCHGVDPTAAARQSLSQRTEPGINTWPRRETKHLRFGSPGTPLAGIRTLLVVSGNSGAVRSSSVLEGPRYL